MSGTSISHCLGPHIASVNNRYDIGTSDDAADANTCAADCAATTACSHFTFIWNTCFLKSSGAGKKAAEYGVGGSCGSVDKATTVCSLTHPNTDFYGGDIPGAMHLPAEDAQACATLCETHGACTHFTYIWNRCYLKSDGAGAVTNVNGKSGTCTAIAE